MTNIRRAALTLVALAIALAGALYAVGEGRVIGTVQDPTGAPIEGAKVVLTQPGTAYKLEKVSDKKGQFMLLILDATQTYQIHVEKEGYGSYDGPLKPKLQDVMRTTFELVKATPKEDTVAKELSGEDKAILTYNEGVTALRANDMTGAVAKFEQAVALNPKLADAQAVLAELYLELKRPADAVAAADRFLALKPGDPRGLKVRYDALKATGDSAKAKEALEALGTDAKDRETAVRFFNEGAERTRTGDYDGAAAFFAKAVAIAPDDPQFAKAHYVVGITLAKDSAKKEEAKAHLQKFLELAPNDPDAKTAKDMLEYLSK
jgi:tetratricopeptide (TPR) repeat protein